MNSTIVRYSLFADDVCVWTGGKEPTQGEVDRVALWATKRGWNGTTLELEKREWVRTVYPSEDALS